MDFKHIHLIDTSTASDNVGDEIIVQETKRALSDILANAYVTTSSGHDGFGAWSRDYIANADLVFLLGTNALDPRYRLGKKTIWSLTRHDVAPLEGKLVLVGVGANHDYSEVAPKQQKLLGRLLSRDHVHSVRDNLGAKLVEQVGHRAVNTTCPTLWHLPRNYTRSDTRPDSVVFTLTKHKAASQDQAMLDILRKLYAKVWFWPQQPRDLDYLKMLQGAENVGIIAPNLAAYDRLLSAEPIDVVGTRLHGSIRGLKHGQRTLVVAIDNRAREIGQETGLLTVARDDIPDQLETILSGPMENPVQLPADNIRRFLSQF